MSERGHRRPLRRGDPGARRSQYVLRLYVVGATPGSQRAISNLREICETELAGRYELEVIDIYQQPTLGAEASRSSPRRR